MDCRSKGSLTVDNSARSKDIRSRCRGRLITFDMLPDDVLLAIFDFYLVRYSRKKEFWITLAHVCRRWRSVVFESPHRLNLRLVCKPWTFVRDALDTWPPLPLIISGEYREYYAYEEPVNIIAALEHNDRVCQINLSYINSQLESVANSAAMRKPFPELTDLRLTLLGFERPEPMLPDSFLAGTAPRLCSLYLKSVPFPGLPKLLMSATHLVKLYLHCVPCSGYIPPEAMATSISALASLEILHFDLRPHEPETRLPPSSPPPPTRSILPNLTEIIFKGASEYLEVILARVDAPRVKHFDTEFFDQFTFDTTQLFQIISRRPTLRELEIMGCIKFDFQAKTIIVKFQSRRSDIGKLRMGRSCMVSRWQLLSLEQVWPSSLPLVSTLKDLCIYDRVSRHDLPIPWPNGDANTLWLELLRPFVSVKNLYLSKQIVPRIAPALQELVGGRTTEVFPALENIFLGWAYAWQSGSIRRERGGIKKFVAARQLTSHPVAVSTLEWERHREIIEL